MFNKLKSKWFALLMSCLVLGSSAYADAPTTIEGVADLSADYLSKGTLAAVGAGILSFGWVLLRIVKKYTSRA